MKKSDEEQILATIRDTHPRIWWAIYVGSIAAGFTPRQSMLLVQSWVLSRNVVAAQPNSEGDGQEPEEDE